MVADFMTKQIQGSHFRHLRDYIMGTVCSSKPKIETVNFDKKINSNKKKVNSKGHDSGGTVNDIAVPQECVGVYS
jgi:hypothetical protein